MVSVSMKVQNGVGYVIQAATAAKTQVGQKISACGSIAAGTAAKVANAASPMFARIHQFGKENKKAFTYTLLAAVGLVAIYFAAGFVKNACVAPKTASVDPTKGGTNPKDNDQDPNANPTDKK